MAERRDFECGCRWRKADGNWWQTVACPDHQMDMLPKTEPIMIARQVPGG